MVMSAFLRAEMILESHAEVDSNQLPSGNTPYQLVQCSTVPNNKKLNNPSLITKNSSRAKQPFSCDFDWIYRADLRLK